MKIALIGSEREENLALRYLHSSVIHSGHKADLFAFDLFNQSDTIVQNILNYAPDVIALGLVFTGYADEGVKLVQRLRDLGYKGHITAGGLFATFHADEILNDFPIFDSMIKGDAEETLVDVLNNLSCLHNVPGLTFRNESKQIITNIARKNPMNLDDLTWPTRLPPFHKYLEKPIAGIVGTRGCYANCNFCSVIILNDKSIGPRFRQRSVDSIVSEMSHLYFKYGIRIFDFKDDNFYLPQNERNVKRFRALKQQIELAGMSNISLQIKARADNITFETLSILKNIGLTRIFIGIETNSNLGLQYLNKKTTRDDNRRALNLLREMNVHTSFHLMIFNPETTCEDLREDISLIRQYSDFPLNFGRVEVYTGTPLERKLREEGRLLGNYFGYHYKMSDPKVQLAFEIFREVFMKRNFEDKGLHLMAMRLDYYYHILHHYYPQLAHSSITVKTKELLKELNYNSAELLDDICDFVDQEKKEVKPFIQNLIKNRHTFDERLFCEYNVVINEIKDLVRKNSQQSQFSVSPELVAATLLVLITVTGCIDYGKKQSISSETDKTVAEQVQAPHKVPSLSNSAIALVQNRVNKVYLKQTEQNFHNLLKSKGILSGLSEEEVDIILTFDSNGKIIDHDVVIFSADANLVLLKDMLNKEIITWTFPDIQEHGQCRIKFKVNPIEEIPIEELDDWNMVEWGMWPMGDKDSNIV